MDQQYQDPIAPSPDMQQQPFYYTDPNQPLMNQEPVQSYQEPMQDFYAQQTDFQEPAPMMSDMPMKAPVAEAPQASTVVCEAPVDFEEQGALEVGKFTSPMRGGRARIRVIGVGGGGSNSVSSMLRLGLRDVDFLVVNTDVQALETSPSPLKLQIGTQVTRGLGAGSNPEVGRAAAEASREEIQSFLRGADMVFIAAGMGGGTGTGAAPVVARIARELGVLSVGVCTRPFKFEGSRRQQQAEEGLAELSREADTMIVVSNQKLLEAVGPNVPMKAAFEMANQVLAQGVGAISELVNVPGLINVDFADIRAILRDSGDAIMGIGRAKGEQRARAAVNKACSSALIDKMRAEGARGILLCIHGGPDLTLHEVNEAASLVNSHACEEANIIFGAVIDENLQDELKVTVLATGFSPRMGAEQPIGSQMTLPQELDPLEILESRRETMSGQSGMGRRSANPVEASTSAGTGTFGALGSVLDGLESEPDGVAGAASLSALAANGRERLGMGLGNGNGNGHGAADEDDEPAYKRAARRQGGGIKRRFF